MCLQCGVERDHERYDPSTCPICDEERQYVRWEGQAWTTQSQLAAAYRNRIEQEAAGLVGIGTEPRFAIGQRALLVRTPAGNVLWDCVSLLDAATVDAVRRAGGLAAIAVSHPHFYGSMTTWSQTFGDVPVYVHRDDAQWVPRTENLVLWDGPTWEIIDGISLVNVGVHFDGGTVLHWADGAGGRGALLTGDVFLVVMDRRHVGFMYSYPNLIPERPSAIRRALERIDGLPFEDIHSAWWGRSIIGDARAALHDSATRYLRRVEE